MTTTDTIRFICSECQYRARLPAKYEGKHIKCPGCKATQQVIADDGESTGSTVAIKRLNESQMTKPDKFRFICGDCGYRARIPVKYAGMAIKCPGCGSAQMAEGSTEPEGDGDGDKPKGDTVQITKVDVQPGASADGRFRFQCDTCGYRAKLPERFLGQNIKCPGCGGAQQALPLDDSVPISGDTMVVKVVEEVPDHELTEQARQQSDAKPVASPPPPPPVAAAAPSQDDDLLLEPTITPPRGVKAINPADVPPEDALQDDEPVIRPGSSAQHQAIPVAQPVDGGGDAGEPDDPVKRQADGSLHYDPFANEREAAEVDDGGESKALLEELRQTRSRPGRGSSNTRKVATPGGAAQPSPAGGGGGGAPPPPESAGTGQTTRRRRSVQGAADAPHSDPTAEETAMPATATAPTPTPVKQGGKGGVIFLTILLLGALAGGGWLYMQWEQTKNDLRTKEGQLTTTEGQLETTRGQLADEQEELALTQTKLTNMTAAKASVEAKLDSAQASLQDTIGKYTAAKANLDDKIDELAAKTEQVTQLQGQVQAGKEQITQLQGQVSDLQGQVSDLQSQANAAKEGASKAAKAEIKQLKEQNKALKAELEALKKKVSESATGGVENLLNP